MAHYPIQTRQNPKATSIVDWTRSDVYHNSFLIPDDPVLDAVLKNCEANGITFPELDDPYDPASEAARSLVEVQTTIVAAAANQLLMSVRRPQTLISLRALDVSLT